MLFIVSNSEIAKVEIVGMKTIITPLITPGIDSGTTTLRKTVMGLAPKSCAASM